MDGLDVAVCRLNRRDELDIDLVAFETVAMPDALRQAMTPGQLTSIAAVARLNQALGCYFADAVSDVLTPLGIVPDLIGSHGQTVYHEHGITTLQLGEPAPMAARFGCPVVHDFRMNDIALGGCGAPLVPYVDQRMLGAQHEPLLAINIGGIANITALPGRSDVNSTVLGMDCGPGNMLMDGLAKRWSAGGLAADIDGRLAREGHVDADLLQHLKSHPYFQSAPRRSTGREQFGDDFLESFLNTDELGRDNGQRVRDVMATLAALTVWGVVDTYERFVRERCPAQRVIVSGGGSRNPILMRGLSEGFAPLPVQSSDVLGMPVDAKEAMAFAILASDRVDGMPTNLPSVTGASRCGLLGKITEC